MVWTQNKPKMSIQDYLTQKKCIYWWLKGAWGRHACKHYVCVPRICNFLICMYRAMTHYLCVATLHTHTTYAHTLCIIHARYQVLIGISKLDYFSLIESRFPVLQKHLSTKINPRNWNKHQKHENHRINVFTPLSGLDFKGLAQNSLLKPLHTWC